MSRRDSADQPQVALELPPRPGNPRNSEGAFLSLRDGRLLFVYTRFTGGSGDDASAYLAARHSFDGGKSWSDIDHTVLENEGRENVMSVSLERLEDGRILLLYLRKNSFADCRPFVRFSSDEAASWSEPIGLIPDADVGYYVVNNDRLVRLRSGRLLLPAALHRNRTESHLEPAGVIHCHLSDDGGRTWRRSQDAAGPDCIGTGGAAFVAQEPGVIELRDGRVMLFARTDAGSQFLSFSEDRAETWSSLRPSGIRSPLSPASIKRIPATGDLLMVWNDHASIAPEWTDRRTPLSAAISRDDGRTWLRSKAIHADPHGWYCYTAIAFAGDHVLLAHCAGDRRENNGLALTRITRVPLGWLYA